MQVKIFDTDFAHAWYMGGENAGHNRQEFPADPGASKYSIRWYRGEDYYPTCFFVNDSMRLAETVEAERKIAMLLEPPAYMPGIWTYVTQHQDLFDYVLTCSEQLIRQHPSKFLWFVNAEPWLRMADRQIYPKTKLVSMIASGKRQLPGHQFRYEVISKLGARIAVFAGTGGPKLPMLQDYMFSVAIMNSKFDSFYTEVLNDVIAAGTVPIFWGTRGVVRDFDPRGIIFFDTLEELTAILDRLTPELYLSMLPAVQRNFERVCKYRVPEDLLYDLYPDFFSDAK